MDSFVAALILRDSHSWEDLCLGRLDISSGSGKPDYINSGLINSD